MTEAGNAIEQRYRIVLYGGGVEEVDRFAIRDRIRTGELTAETEISLLRSDEWRPAASFPEFSRYFELAATGNARPGPSAAAPKRDVEPMSRRIVAGLGYPLGGGEVFLLIGLAVLSAIPIIGFLATFASTLIMVEIVRASANGKTKFPLVDTSQAWDLVRTYLRVMFVTLVSLLPLIVFAAYAVRGLFTGQMSASTAMFGVVVALAFAAVYYPACLVTIAVWDNVLDSLNPRYISLVIRRMGADYFIVIAMWFVATAASMFLSFVSPFRMIPLFGGIISSVLSLWALFYVSHLLGYAVYRHERDLGWE